MGGKSGAIQKQNRKNRTALDENIEKVVELDSEMLSAKRKEGTE